MIRKLIEDSKRNYFHIEGNLVEDPVKDLQVYDEEEIVVAFCKIKTKFLNTYVEVPVLFSGEKVDAFVAMRRRGDKLSIDGMFIELYGKVQLLVVEFNLIKKKMQHDEEVIDKFQKIVELYSVEGIERRKKCR